MHIKKLNLTRLNLPLKLLIVAMICLMLGGCSGNVGVGMSVGVPVGSHGHMTVGGSRWF